MASVGRAILPHPNKQICTLWNLYTHNHPHGLPGSQGRTRTPMTSYRHKAQHRSDVVFPLNYLTMWGVDSLPSRN